MEGRHALLAVCAHPDDETIYMGGTLARYAAAGARVVCATATRGELGEIVDPALATQANLEGLGAIRIEEMQRALGRLGPVEIRWLGYRDSGMAGDPHNDDDDALSRAPQHDVAGAIARLIREVRPQVVVTLDEARADDHPDHLQAASATRLAFDGAGKADCWPEQLDGPEAVGVWTPSKLYAANGHSQQPMRAWPRVKHLLRVHGPIRTGWMLAKAMVRRRPGGGMADDGGSDERLPATTRIDVTAWVAARQGAVRAYRTQIARDDPMLRLSARELAGLSPTEDFRLLAGPTAAIPEDDLFAGLD